MSENGHNNKEAGHSNEESDTSQEYDDAVIYRPDDYSQSGDEDETWSETFEL